MSTDSSRDVSRWQRVKEVLYEAMQLDAVERGAFLDQACGNDAGLRSEVDSLLRGESKVQSEFLEPPLGQEATALEPGQLFAERFRLIRVLGEGGMGQVWLAEQSAPVVRQVALKLIKAGMYDAAVARRFIGERQSLAIMDHPAIAKVFDAGATPQGQPYFVMEYVAGLPITEYCDRHALSIRARLELFIQACEGVQHAHVKAVIHRDLKPANVLVLEVDGRPVPRIIDFGLAKAVSARDDAQATRVGLLFGTPGYMSPEQVDGASQDIDTRTDVYSLGVILYVLLTGLQPFESKRRDKPPLDVWLRQLREEEAPPPSGKVTEDRETAAVRAAQRGARPKELARQLRSDLDWVAMKALARDREQRYPSPAALAEDLRRYLDFEPVEARPASAAYRARKYVRRHRVAVGIGLGLVVVFAGFSALQAVELQRTELERDRANQERDRAARITDFMTSMFKVPDPNEARGNSVTAREILDKAAQDVSSGLAHDPVVQAQMMAVMARTYANLGLNARAHELAKSALDARMSLLGSDNPQTLESMVQLGRILDDEGKPAEAEVLERRAVEGDRRVLGAEARPTLEATYQLSVLRGDQSEYADSQALAGQVVALGTRKFGTDDELVIKAHNELGLALVHQARYAEGEREFRHVVDSAQRVFGADHPRSLAATGNLAWVLQMQGRLAEAAPLYRANLAARQRMLGPEHPSTLVAADGYAGVLLDQGQFAEAERLYRDTLAIRTRVLGAEHADTLRTASNLAGPLYQEGRLQEAEKLQREVLAAQTHLFGANSPNTLYSEAALAATLVQEGVYSEAESLARAAFDESIKTLGQHHPFTEDARLALGRALALTHRYEEAGALFHQALDSEQNAPSAPGEVWSLWYGFASVATAAADSDGALRYLREAQKHGFSNADGLLTDSDFKPLRARPDFLELVAQVRQGETRVD